VRTAWWFSVSSWNVGVLGIAYTLALEIFFKSSKSFVTELGAIGVQQRDQIARIWERRWTAAFYGPGGIHPAYTQQFDPWTKWGRIRRDHG
jgi:hypothetical protein